MVTESKQMQHCWASLVNKMPGLAERIAGGPGRPDGVAGPGEGEQVQAVELVGQVAHGLALRGTESFLPWMERLLHFLDTDETGEWRIGIFKLLGDFIKLFVFFHPTGNTRALDSDPHESALIFPTGTGSAFNMRIRIQGEKIEK